MKIFLGILLWAVYFVVICLTDKCISAYFNAKPNTIYENEVLSLLFFILVEIIDYKVNNKR